MRNPKFTSILYRTGPNGEQFLLFLPTDFSALGIAPKYSKKVTNGFAQVRHQVDVDLGSHIFQAKNFALA